MRKNTLILLAIIIILVILAIFQGRKVSRLSDEVERQKGNVQTLVEQETIYKICDSINVSQINALQLDKEQFETLVLEKDKQISQLKNQRKKDMVISIYKLQNRIHVPKFILYVQKSGTNYKD